MSSADPAVSVVVPARDAAATLPGTLAGLAAQRSAPPFEVIVVDNGSHDDTAEIAERSPAVTAVLRRERGKGPGAARNDGVRLARAGVIAFTDSDCAPTPEWLAEGVAALDRGADIVQGKVLPDPEGDGGPFPRTLGVVSEYGLYETANLFVRREWFERIGPFEDFVPGTERPFGEDAWWAWRARRAGARTAFGEAALVHHAVDAQSAAQYVRGRGHVEWFPDLVARVPELREAFLWRRIFLSRRSAAFDLAAAGALAALAARRPWPLLAAAPYARMATRDRRGRVLAADVAADAVGAAALVRGSIRARTPVL